MTDPARTVAAVTVCALVMIAAAGATARGMRWCAFGIPLAPLVAAGLTCRRASTDIRPRGSFKT